MSRDGTRDAFDDIRDHLRRDHAWALAELDALRAEDDDHRCRFRLAKLRRAWMIHALAEEAVVYRALEGACVAANSATRVEERFVEHELVESVFAKMSAGRTRSPEWTARLNVVRDLIARHVESEHAETFARLARRFDSQELCELGRRFELAREKLTLLEEAKAA
jgi:hypothetical protein